MKSFKRLSTIYISFLLSTEIFVVAAKLSLGPTIEDDADISPHRLRTTLGVTGKRFLRGDDRNFQAAKVDNTLSVKNKGNKIKTEGQQHRDMEIKDSNIFFHKVNPKQGIPSRGKRKGLKKKRQNHRKKNVLPQTTWTSSYGIGGFKEKNDSPQTIWTSSYRIQGFKDLANPPSAPTVGFFDKELLPKATSQPPTFPPSKVATSYPTSSVTISPTKSPTLKPTIPPLTVAEVTSKTPTSSPTPLATITKPPTKALCPFTEELVDMVTLANNGKITLDECSCKGYDDVTKSNLGLGYLAVETDNNGNKKVPGFGSIGYYVYFYRGQYTYQIHDMVFDTEEGVYNACLQVLRNNCQILSTLVPGPGCQKEEEANPRLQIRVTQERVNNHELVEMSSIADKNIKDKYQFGHTRLKEKKGKLDQEARVLWQNQKKANTTPTQTLLLLITYFDQRILTFTATTYRYIMKSFSNFLLLLNLSSTSLCTASLLRGSENLLKRVLKKNGNNGNGRGRSKATTTTQTGTSIDLSLCPFDTKGMEDMVALANNGTIQLNQCSCNRYDDAANIDLIMHHTVISDASYYDANGTLVEMEGIGTKAFGASGSYGYQYQIDDMMFMTEQEIFNACLQLLRNKCGELDTDDLDPISIYKREMDLSKVSPKGSPPAQPAERATKEEE
ncbi:predicted protein [Chaetoceros tenuissimus]|uniref:Uncharacterized protein n=1 Tax=Chaetoceros tenuissimus TaxID=426638 RepID=A0AAD3H9K7_9STRA|nr:predicted protein [Chaetoceros tenuissimus]